jgi:hypothetical protein
LGGGGYYGDQRAAIWKRKEEIFFKEIRDSNLGLLVSKIITRM